jgi:predicted nucleic acid-binding protein
VVGETYTLLRVRLGWRVAQEFLQRTRHSPTVERAFVEASWEILAEMILAQFDDHDFSYVDATSFAAMRQLNLVSALAFDHHFVIAGFQLIQDDF